MTLSDALNLYKLPYNITSTTTAGGFTSYTLAAAGSSATLARLQARLTDINAATGEQYEIIQNAAGLSLRSRNGQQAFYNYSDYNGYINENDSKIPFIVGFNSYGGIILDNLNDARHILIAGTTGSGKSVFLHNLIYTFCCNAHTNIYLVDCKKVELSIYDPRCYVVSDVFGERSAARLTADFCRLIDNRYNDMLSCGVNDFEEYRKIRPNEKRKILVIDELADLINDKQARKVIIPRLLRIAQIGRAAGCHLILATQRPDHTIINGTLKGNLPTRLAFNCISNTDSRVILDRGGAEHLTGNGDGLYLKNGALSLERIQAPYIDINMIKDKISEYKLRTA